MVVITVIMNLPIIFIFSTTMMMRTYSVYCDQHISDIDVQEEISDSINTTITTGDYLNDAGLIQGICTVGMYQCKNDTFCVAGSEICNGRDDCSNGSDEKYCSTEDADKFYDHLVRKRPSAENDHLVAGTCNLTSQRSPCVCRGSRELLCGFKNLTHIPKDLPRDDKKISFLDFEGNHFGTLGREELEHIPKDVVTLNFAHCGVNTINPGAFFGLHKIRDLYLDNNELKTFPAGIFPANNSLQSLFFSHNYLGRIDSAAFHNLTALTKLDLSGNKITEIDLASGVLAPLKNLRTLYLKNNHIRHVAMESFPALRNLVELSLVDNKIETFGEEPFSRLAHLRTLYLSGNRLVVIRNSTFAHLTRLEDLTLDKNFIEKIEDGVFADTPRLKSLSLLKNQIRFLSKNVLNPLKSLRYVHFDMFELCDSVPPELTQYCYPKGDGISDFGHLLANPILRVCVWIMGAVGCTGNLIVLFGRFLAPTTNNVVHSLYLRNLAFSDLLMGFYLFTIAAADLQFRRKFLNYQYDWRHGYICKLCGFISTLSCESSVLILSLVTWDRFVSVTQPLARKQPSPKTAALTLAFLWALSAIVAFVPFTTLSYFGDEFYGNNGVCLALHIHEPYAMGWEYSAAMFMFVNAVALAFISYAYIRMINEIKASGVACRSTRQSQDRDKVAQRFGIIVLTDCLCWLPIIIVKLVALAGQPISADLYAWLAIFILPINSALNPILYTLTTTIFKKQMRKILNSCVYKRRRQAENNHSAASESGFSLSFGVFPIGGSTRRILSYRGTQSSSLNSTTAKTSSNWKRTPTAV